MDLEQLYDQHAAFIGRAIRRLTGDGPHVDDILQETFIVAWRKQATLDPAREVRAWLYAVASRLCKRHTRSARRASLLRLRFGAEPAPHQPAQPDRQLLREQRTAALLRGLQRLPYKQREVFVLYELEELPGEEIARLLGVPLGTVWTRLHHARKRYAQLMHRQLEQEEAG